MSQLTPIHRRTDYVIGFIAPAISPNKETHMAYSASTQYTRQSLSEKQHTWFHRQTVISCEAMYVVFHSTFCHIYCVPTL